MTDESRVSTTTLPARILICEDDPTIGKLLEKTFSKECEVFLAVNGQEGLEILRTKRPEFVITDLMMPVMDGLELIRRARKTSQGACTPILVLTSKQDENVLLDCFRKGADDFMVKPFSVAELRVRVQSIFLRTRVARDSNPLTKLPGNHVLKREIETRMRASLPMAVVYVDLDHFKEFNDTHGFDRGDLVLQLMSDILQAFSATQPEGEVFVGHIGGDDFVTILPVASIDDLATYVFEEFTKATAPLFTDEEVERGTFRSVSRGGKEVEVPLISVSLGVITNQREGMTDVRAVAQVAAEVKKMAKDIPGNSIFFDRRTE